MTEPRNTETPSPVTRPARIGDIEVQVRPAPDDLLLAVDLAFANANEADGGIAIGAIRGAMLNVLRRTVSAEDASRILDEMLALRASADEVLEALLGAHANREQRRSSEHRSPARRTGGRRRRR
jgi:hypothetical protein